MPDQVLCVGEKRFPVIIGQRPQDVLRSGMTHRLEDHLEQAQFCGVQLKIVDVNGRSTTFTYTSISNYALITKVTNAFGNTVALEYDSSLYPHHDTAATVTRQAVAKLRG